MGYDRNNERKMETTIITILAFALKISLFAGSFWSLYQGGRGRKVVSDPESVS